MASENQVRKLNWQHAEIVGAKDREISELRKEKEQLKSVKQSVLEEYEKKMAELLESLHAVERAFVQQREQYELKLRQQASTREEELRQMSSRLKMQLDSVEDQLRHSERAREELRARITAAEGRSTSEMHALHGELEDARSQLNAAMTKEKTMTRETETKVWKLEQELKRAQESRDALESELAGVVSERSSIQGELEQAVARGASLKENMASQNAAWQKRWERERAELMAQHGNLTSILQKQRDHLEAQNRGLDERLAEMEREGHELRGQLNESKADARSHAKRAEDVEVALKNATERMERAEARIGVLVSADSRRGGDASPQKLSESAEASPQKLSASANPRQSTDSDEFLGPASPLRPLDMDAFSTSLPPSPSPSPQRSAAPPPAPGTAGAPLHVPEAASAQLRYENAKLRAAVGAMAREMESLRKQPPPSAEDAEQFDTGGGIHISRRGSVDITLPGGGEGGSAPPVAAALGRQSVAAGRSSSDRLRSELEAAHSDVAELMAEREKLMELSNQLRADLNHAVAAEADESELSQVAKKVEEETASRYQRKVESVERRLRDLQSHNRALTSELHKWAAGGSSFDVDTSGVYLNEYMQGSWDNAALGGDDATAEGGSSDGEGARARLRTEVREVDTSMLPARLKQLMHAQRRRNQDEWGGVRKPTSDGAHGGDDVSPLPGTAGGGGGGGGRLPVRASKPQSKARARLQKVREDLKLVATKPVMNVPRAGGVSSSNSMRTTVSQRKSSARMQKQQTRKRRELTEMRRSYRSAAKKVSQNVLAEGY